MGIPNKVKNNAMLLFAAVCVFPKVMSPTQNFKLKNIKIF